MKSAIWGLLLALVSLSFAAAPPPSARQGRNLYITPAPGTQACASCHGLGGQGGYEGGITIPSLFTDLTPGAICAAVRDGKAGDGRRLSVLMPRREVSDKDCLALWSYLSDADSAPVPGLSDQLFVVEIEANGGMLARLERQLSVAFEAVNAQGGVYGRALEARIGGDAPLRISLAPTQQQNVSSLEITLAVDTDTAASRAIETSIDVEREILLGEIARSGLTAVVWMAEEGRADVALAARRHDLKLVLPEACGQVDVALVLASATVEVPEACVAHAKAYVLLRSVPVPSLLAVFARRPSALSVEMVAPVPADLSLVADLLARITIGTATELGPHTSERRLLMAFDSAWNSVAQSRETLFSGISVQAISLPALEPTQPPRWIME